MRWAASTCPLSSRVQDGKEAQVSFPTTRTEGLPHSQATDASQVPHFVLIDYVAVAEASTAPPPVEQEIARLEGTLVDAYGIPVHDLAAHALMGQEAPGGDDGEALRPQHTRDISQHPSS